MQYAACIVPVSPLRSDPSHKSEMVSQVLFGERCLILESATDNWVRIQCAYDDYTGWCQRQHLIEINEKQFNEEGALARGWSNKIITNGQVMHIPFGSFLSLSKRKKLKLGNKTFNCDCKTSRPGKNSNKSLKKIALKYIRTPYLWGGKSVYGIDCSGFTQSVFKFLDIKLPRDSWQQEQKGELVSSIESSKRGDLAFFKNSGGKITHVGILLNKYEIIHASGNVRIDKISEHGIINIDTDVLTHSLASIKRYF